MTGITRRQFSAMTGTVAAGMAMSGQSRSPVRAATPPAASPFAILPYVHPELRAAAKSLLSMDAGPLNAATLATFRKTNFPIAPLAAPAWSERMIPGLAGAPDVRIVIINAKADGSARPAILHTHGGGYVGGSAKAGLHSLQEIAAALDCVIVTVDYRLAPETRFGGSLEDNYAGLKWLYRHAAEIGGDRNRIALYGESAGGGHAALLAVAARDRGEIPLVLQAMMYPMLDDRTGSTSQKPPYMGALVWTPQMNRFGWTSFLGAEAGSAQVPIAAVPARNANLIGLPPAFIAVGSIDLFLDEDIAYARRLADTGIAIELHVIPGAFHAFDEFPTPTLGRNFRIVLLDAFRQAFGTRTAHADR